MTSTTKNVLRRKAIAVSALALCLGFANPSLAQSGAQWPSKPLTWIVPFAAGGPTDAMARDIAERVGKLIGQNIIIENAAGAGGTVGAVKASKAAPDGYTFLVGHMGYMGAGPSLYPKLGYDPVKSFDPVFRFPDTPLVLLVGANSRFKTVADLIAEAKAKPGSINFGNAGVGSTSHLIAALFESRAGIEGVSVAYKGAGPAMVDLIGGQVQAMFDQSNTALPQVQAGRLRALALTSLTTMPQQYPGVPTLAEKTIPGFEAATWYGLYAPAGTPKDYVQKLHRAYLTALRDKEWTAKMSGLGIHLLSEAQYSPDAFAKHTASEVDKWKKVVADAKITLQ